MAAGAVSFERAGDVVDAGSRSSDKLLPWEGVGEAIDDPIYPPPGSPPPSFLNVARVQPYTVDFLKV